MNTTKLLTTTAAAALCLFAYSANAFVAAPPPAPFNANYGAALECSIVRHTPDRDRDTAYKVNIILDVDNGIFRALNVGYTLVSGRFVDRSSQYQNGRTWQTPHYLEWNWAGSRGHTTINGRLYHNDRDGWMYTESIFENNRLTYQMLADCHAMEGA
jgi:hypothetical protein